LLGARRLLQRFEAGEAVKAGVFRKKKQKEKKKEMEKDNEPGKKRENRVRVEIAKFLLRENSGSIISYALGRNKLRTKKEGRALIIAQVH